MSNATMAPQGRDITNLSPLFFLASHYMSPVKNFLSFTGTELLGFAQLSII